MFGTVAVRNLVLPSIAMNSLLYSARGQSSFSRAGLNSGMRLQLESRKKSKFELSKEERSQLAILAVRCIVSTNQSSDWSGAANTRRSYNRSMAVFPSADAGRNGIVPSMPAAICIRWALPSHFERTRMPMTADRNSLVPSDGSFWPASRSKRRQTMSERGSSWTIDASASGSLALRSAHVPSSSRSSKSRTPSSNSSCGF
mmetsp:Transcript_4020/g.8756  ORF Transcript_4020/g.8756 Transcript_4020/m.8756 type:complete len:201 (+) Transcript_4020:1213-1815(+)